MAQKTLKSVLTLKIDREGGANGAAVAWHPVQKKYYAAMAGNVSFPLEVFDVKGKMLSDDNLETQFDIRGFWYNPNRKSLQMNGYNDFGWAEYKVNGNGIPIEVVKMPFTASQPSEQSAGAYDPKKNAVYFLNFETKGAERHDAKTGVEEVTIKLHLGAKKAEDIQTIEAKEIKDEYNENALIFTDVTNGELGLLNVTSRQIELYSTTTGYMTQVLSLPDDANVELSLNFSYCNGMYWLFDKKLREWRGYKA